ncbi:hypothetical protein [uncultured Acinetobacter sp.]|uniref:hypothetical protein n=1 Tax=uncultured Acinetobacter sp. TaxID=165433 RepID=UPI0025845FBB|nr:hypothetical protein [uncultured Acinetobacter sp.]
MKVSTTSLIKNCEIILNDQSAIHTYDSFNNLIPFLISNSNIKARTIIGFDTALNNDVHKADSASFAEKCSLEFIEHNEIINIKVTDKNNKPTFGNTKPKFIPI